MLDEPTNHLDIASQEILQTVLAGFDGTILLDSHDRYLVDALATQIWAVSPGKLTVFKGTYKEYAAARDAQPAVVPEKPGANVSAARPAAQPQKKNGLNAFQLQKKVAELEAAIETLEDQLEELNSAIAAASSQGDAGKVAELGAAYTRAEADLHAAMEEWATLAD
jgi:ATP-binding cassette subfamily F protein 3